MSQPFVDFVMKCIGVLNQYSLHGKIQFISINDKICTFHPDHTSNIDIKQFHSLKTWRISQIRGNNSCTFMLDTKKQTLHDLHESPQKHCSWKMSIFNHTDNIFCNKFTSWSWSLKKLNTDSSKYILFSIYVNSSDISLKQFHPSFEMELWFQFSLIS